MTMSDQDNAVQDTIPLVDEGQTEAPGCAGSSRELRDQAAQQANQATLDQYAEDYPVGPHDQPQSMCPAFGSLRVGLRMRRTATVLSGSACCVYGLTFTSHFYGARRTVGYVPFDSETLVTGKLFEDIRESVHQLADPDKYDAVVVINLCVPTASGVPLDLLPKQINGVRIIGIRCARLWRAHPCGGQGRAGCSHAEIRAHGSGRRPRGPPCQYRSGRQAIHRAAG